MSDILGAMKSVSNRFCSILFHLTANLFPDSYYYLNIGKHSFHIKIGLKYRRFLAEHILAHCGKEVNIERHAHFNRNISLGDCSGIGSHCHIGGNTFIGNYVMMGPEVIVYTQNHRFDRTDIPMCQQGFQESEPVHIGNDVWIGRRVMIMPGVTIGDGCVIGAGAVVAKDMPPYSIVVGNPARVVRNRLNSRNIGGQDGPESDESVGNCSRL